MKNEHLNPDWKNVPYYNYDAETRWAKRQRETKMLLCMALAVGVLAFFGWVIWK